MDGLCLTGGGIQGMAGPIAIAGGLDVRSTQFSTSAVGRSSMSVEKTSSCRNKSWGFSFRYPLRSFWSGGKGRYDAIAVDDAVLMEEKNEEKNENWVLKILHIRSLQEEKVVMTLKMIVKRISSMMMGMKKNVMCVV